MNTQLAMLNKQGIDAAKRGNFYEAEIIFRSAIQVNSKSYEATFNLIKLLHMANKHHDAILFFNKIDNNSMLKNLPMRLVNIIGDCVVNDQDTLSACKCCEILLNTFPGHIEIACRFSSILIKTGQLAKAKCVLNASYLINRGNPNLLTQLAITESELGNYSRAEEIHLELVARFSNQFLSNFNYGLFLSMLGRNDDALTYFNRCLEIVPNAPEAISSIEKLSQNKDSLLSNIYDSIESEMYHDAILKLQSAKEILDPIIYWAALRDIPANVAILIDDVDLVSPYIQIECLDLFNNLEEQTLYLAQLEEYINKQESLIWDRAGKPTRRGRQSHEILQGSHNQYIIELSNRLKKVINKYMNSRPLLGQIAHQKGQKNDLSGWAVSLTKGGYQKRHIHPDAVVSGVLYIKLSDECRSCSHNEGNLMFSSPHCSRMITPKEGMVVLFPSYLAHETIPFTNDQERICIAFNFA